MAARGIAPGLKPFEAIAIVGLLAESDQDVAQAARATLDNLPAPLLAGALTPDLAPGVLDLIAPKYATDHAVMEKILTLPQILPDTVAVIASRASELVCEIVATNEERLLANPRIIEKLYLNKRARMSTADRILELAVRNGIELAIPAFKEAAAAIQGQLITEGGSETPGDVHYKETVALVEATEVPIDQTHVVDKETGEEKVAKAAEEVDKKLHEMTTSERVRRAMMSTKAHERAILLRDTSRLVAMAAIKNPQVAEDEVVRATSSASLHAEVLGYIARHAEWRQTYQIKLNLCTNPRTPMMQVTQLIAHLREHDLKKLAASKNVSGAVRNLARNHLSRKGIK